MKHITRLNKDQISLLKGGHMLSNGDDIYMHQPYYYKPRNVKDGEIQYDEDGFTTCELMFRSDIPNAEAGYKKGGLKTRKYIIRKADDTAVDPSAWYFVLRIDKDPNARAAAKEYVASVKYDNPLLAMELMNAVMSYEKTALETPSFWEKYYPYDFEHPGDWNTDDQEMWSESSVSWLEFVQIVSPFRK